MIITWLWKDCWVTPDTNTISCGPQLIWWPVANNAFLLTLTGLQVTAFQITVQCTLKVYFERSTPFERLVVAGLTMYLWGAIMSQCGTLLRRWGHIILHFNHRKFCIVAAASITTVCSWIDDDEKVRIIEASVGQRWQWMIHPNVCFLFY